MHIKNRLRVLSFLQYFIWGSWLITLGAYMINTLGFTGLQVGAVYSTKGIAAIVMPGLVGIIADRFVPANRLYVLCHLVSGVTLFVAASVNDPTLMFWVMLVNMMAFVPTIALSNTLSYFCLEQSKLDATSHFPQIRVFGTAGFILAMWTISLLKFELSNVQLYIAAGASLVLSFYSLTIPRIPIDTQRRDETLISKLGLNAIVLLKQPRMAVFFMFAMLLGVVLQITNTFGNPFLRDFAQDPAYKDSVVVQYPSMLLSVSQLSEIVFILAIPFFLKRFGIKTVMIISMLAWTLRFGLFAIGDPSPAGFALLTLSMIAYGCAFDFFNVSGSIFIEKEVKSNIRASAQGLFMTTVNGLGAFVGAWVSGMMVDYFTVGGVRDWPAIWSIFAAYTFVLAILFFFTFNDEQRHSAAEQEKA